MKRYIGPLVVTSVLMACITGEDPLDEGSPSAPDAGGTKDVRADVIDAQSSDGEPPAGPPERVYFGACLTELTPNQLAGALHFYVKVRFVALGAGKAGSLRIGLTPMKVDGPGAPRPVSKNETVGATFSFDATTAESGVYAASVVQIAIPEEANPVSSRALVIQELELPGRYAEAGFCSRFGGRVTAPFASTLDPSKNTCRFFPVDEAAPQPSLSLDMFQGCPLD